MSIRKVLFWTHLTCGCIGGLIILTMSITGVLLMYERQLLAHIERGSFRADPPAASAARMPVEELLAKVSEQRGGLARNASLTLRSDPSEPAELAVGPEAPLYIDSRTGRVLGQSSGAGRRFFQELRAWHRWLGVQGKGRPLAKAITGACNLAFLVIIVSGPFLWLPKQWTRQRLAPIVWFRKSVAGKSRDFNWHNVFGIWSAVPLFFVVLTAIPISYTWGTDLIYRITGTQAPAGAGARPGVPSGSADLTGLNELWTRAESQVSGWQSIAMRLPDSPRAPVSFLIDTGDGGQPQKRSTFTVNRDGSNEQLETFGGQNAGRRVRSWSRFTHTGEAFGLVGQTIAGIASAAGVMLVWTGISLSLRRFAAWRRRRRAAAEPEVLQTR